MNTKDSTPNPMDNPDLPAEVQGLDREQFQVWKSHPVTIAVFRYYQDHREAIAKLHLEWWLDKTELAGRDDLEARLRAQIAQDVIDLKADTIIKFYTGVDSHMPGYDDKFQNNINTEVTGY